MLLVRTIPTIGTHTECVYMYTYIFKTWPQTRNATAYYFIERGRIDGPSRLALAEMLVHAIDQCIEKIRKCHP